MGKVIFKNLILFIIGIIPLVIPSCGNDDEHSRTELLCKEAWKYQGLECPSGGDVSITFKNDGTFSVSVCGRAVPIPKTWSLTEDETKLVLIYDDEGKDEKTINSIIRLTDTELELFSEGETIMLIR